MLSNRAVKKAVDMSDTTAQRRRISKAMATLTFEHPFIAGLAYGLNVYICDKRVPTAGTDGTSIYYNPNFLNQLNDKQVIFLVAHEVMHCVFIHMYRLAGRDMQLWNYACDIVVNEWLIREGIGEPIDDTLIDGHTFKMVRDEALFDKHDGLTERIYNDMLEQAQKAGGSQSFEALDELLEPGKGDTRSVAEREADMKVRVTQAAHMAKQAGKLSAGAQRFIDELISEKLPWEDLLRMFFVRINDTRSFARPNRRHAHAGIMLPSTSGHGMGDIAIGVDCSGSVSAAMLSKFMTQLRAIQEDTRPANIHVIYFDSEVCHYDVFDREEPVILKPHGGGGTAFNPVFEYIEENQIMPVCCVMLTDLYSNDFGPEPDYPVMWATVGNTNAPWGQIVELK
mgnify:CR=1 FL=1